MKMSDSKWSALESSPSVMNKLLQQFGVSDKCQVTDILSLDEDYLATIPTAVHAVILLFPYTRNYRQFRDLLETRAKEGGQPAADSGVFFMRQTIRNSCGTVAMIHAIANNMDVLEFEEGSVVKRFVEKCAPLSPRERAKELENDEAIRKAHDSCARRPAQASIPAAAERSSSADKDDGKDSEEDASSDHHYISFVKVRSKLYDLDGYKEFPICHGDTGGDSFLKDAAQTCLEYIKREPKNLNFTALAFGEAQ